MTDSAPRQKRLDERVAPGWANTSANLLRGGGIAVGLLLLWMGFLTGGFFLLLTGVLGLIALAGGWLLGGLVVQERWYERPAARRLTLAMLIGLPIALVVFAQLAGPLLTPAPATSHCFAGELARGQALDEKLAIDPRLRTMVFRLQIPALEDGAARWFVTDPFGQSRWSGRAEAAGHTEQSRVLESAGGEWSIHVISEAERVEYRLEWAGSTAADLELADPSACPAGES